MAAIYYVSNNGSDSNDGLTLETAFATIDYAVSQVSEETTIHVDKGTYEVFGLSSLSSENGVIHFIGKGNDTVFVISQCTALSNFLNSVYFYKIIFQASDKMTGDARMFCYTKDSQIVHFYNCVFKKSENGLYPERVYFLFHNNDVSYATNKYFHSCSFVDDFPISGYGIVTFNNCAAGYEDISYNSWGASPAHNISECVEDALFDKEHQLTNYDNSLYGVYSGDYSWVVRQVFIKMNNKYYSISEEHYNIETRMYESFDDYNDLNSLTMFKLFEEITINDETFRPIDKFSGEIQLVFDNEVSNVEITGYKSDIELIVGEMFDLREFAHVDYLNTNNSFKMAFCINESQWVTYDFDNDTIVSLDINIPLNKDYGQFTQTEKNNWYDAMLVIEEQGFTADRLSEIDFNQEGWHTIRVAYILKADRGLNDYCEDVGTAPIAIADTIAIVYNDEIHLIREDNHYKWDGSSWTKASTHSYDLTSGAAVVYNNQIHVFGGYISGATYSYGGTNHNIWNGTTWTKKSLPINFRLGSAVVYKNEIHLLGGHGASGGASNYRNTHYKWNGTSWTQVGTLPVGMAYCSAVVYNDELYIYYGSSVYKWNGTDWTQIPMEGCDFLCGDTVVYKDKIHTFANFKHYIFDGTSNNVTIGEDVPYQIYKTPVVVYKDQIHLFGAQRQHFIYNIQNLDSEISGSKYTNQTQDALTLFNATEVGFENEQDGFSKTCENKQLPIFSDNTSRIKTQDGVASDWWLTTNVEIENSVTNEETGEITTTTSTQAAIVSSDGTLDSSDHNAEKGICFGFNI